ncbi:MAG: hypothetical protein B7Z06_11030, partial [Flavobacteriales bacterium 32-35-8]
ADGNVEQALNDADRDGPVTKPIMEFIERNVRSITIETLDEIMNKVVAINPPAARGKAVLRIIQDQERNIQQKQAQQLEAAPAQIKPAAVARPPREENIVIALDSALNSGKPLKPLLDRLPDNEARIDALTQMKRQENKDVSDLLNQFPINKDKYGIRIFCIIR